MSGRTKVTQKYEPAAFRSYQRPTPVIGDCQSFPETIGDPLQDEQNTTQQPALPPKNTKSHSTDGPPCAAYKENAPAIGHPYIWHYVAVPDAEVHCQRLYGHVGSRRNRCTRGNKTVTPRDELFDVLKDR